MRDSELTKKTQGIYGLHLEKFTSFLKVMRIGPALNCVLLVVVGVLLHPNAFTWTTGILATVVMFFVYGIIYLYNYFTDVEEDKLNDKYNPVMNDTYRRIIIAYIVFALMGTIVISLEYLGTIPLAVALFYVFIGVVYSTRPFRIKERFLLKNIFIGLMWGPLLFVMTSSLVNAITPIDLVMAAFYGIISLLASIIGDFRDIDGDREAGFRTIPVVLDIRGAAHYFFILTTLQVLVIVVPVALGYIEPIYLLVLLAMPPRYRLVYSLYSTNLEQIQQGPEMSGAIIATIALFGAALSKLGVF